jgi:3-oxoacyl-[acyl-carrier protein] reductase
MDLKLAGKVVLITGSSRGIGLASAKAFAAEGCRIMLSARSAEQLREAEAALRRTGAGVAAHVADVGDPKEAAGLIDAAVGAYGGIDILVNNVGGGGGGARIADSSDEDWRGALERNLIQTVRMMRLTLPHMKGRSGAAVVNIASISGWTPQLAMSGQYGAAKAALISTPNVGRSSSCPTVFASIPSPRARYWSRITAGTATGSATPSTSTITWAMVFPWDGLAPRGKALT